jgi:hypothetical protein
MAGGDRQGTGGAGGEVAASRAPVPEVFGGGRLPLTSGHLVGRDAELAWLNACWNDGGHVASIVAWGGVGKTSLVSTWLARLRDAGWRGAERVFVWSFYTQGTTGQGSADEMIDAALRWFGDPEPTAGSPWDKGERLAALVRTERTLLVLDGVEPLQRGLGEREGEITDPALQVLVRALGMQNRGLCLITTRWPVLDLEDLGGDKVRRKDLTRLSPEAGVELLKNRGAKGTDEELREAAEEYKGHSLALMLLGSYLGEAYEGDIRRRKEIGPLEQEEHFGGHARRVMAAYERMFQRGPELAILRMLGLFDRPADAAEIDALVNLLPAVPGLTDTLERIGTVKWNRSISRLRRVGLLAPDANDRRLDAHPLVREHFGERLRQECSDAWREGHRRLYEHLKRKAKPFPETVEEMAPLYAAVAHGCMAGRSAGGARRCLLRTHPARQ